MATAGPNFVGTGANVGGSGTLAWTNPTNIQGDTTGTAATVSPAANGDTSQYLRCTGFSFSIPTGATIDGVLVEVEQSAVNANRHRWHSVKMVDAGAEAGTDQSDASAIPTTKGFKSFGSSSNLWGIALTPAKINASNFGVSFQIDRNSTQSTTTSLFRARITVTYHTDATTTLSATGSTSVASFDRLPTKVAVVTGQGSVTVSRLSTKVFSISVSQASNFIRNAVRSFSVTGNGSSLLSRLSMNSFSAMGSSVASFVRNPVHIFSIASTTISDLSTSVIGGGDTFSTGIAILALSPKPPPITRTEHTIYLKGRVTTAGTAHLHAALYENGVNISGDLESDALTTDLVEYALPISDAAAATIDNYSDLEIHMWATSSSPLTFEVSEVYLKVPGESNVTYVTLDAVGQGSAIMMKSSIKILSVVGQGAAFIIRIPAKIFSIAASQVTTLKPSPIKIFSAIGQGSATLSRALSKTFFVVSNPVASLNRVIVKTLSAVGNTATTVLKMPKKILSATGQGSASISIIKISLLTLTAIGQGSASFVKSLVKRFTVNVSTSTTLLRSILRTFSATGTGSAILSKMKPMTLSATGQGSAFIQSLTLKNFVIAANTVTTFSRSLVKNFFVSVWPQAVLRKAIFKEFSVVGQGSAFFDLLKNIPIIRGFYTAMIRREGYYRSYITRVKPTQAIETSTSHSFVTRPKSDEDIIPEGYSSGEIE